MRTAAVCLQALPPRESTHTAVTPRMPAANVAGLADLEAVRPLLPEAVQLDQRRRGPAGCCRQGWQRK